MRRLEILKAREIIRLKYEVGLSLREIGKSCNCGKHTTLDEVFKPSKEAGIMWTIECGDKTAYVKTVPTG